MPAIPWTATPASVAYASTPGLNNGGLVTVAALLNEAKTSYTIKGKFAPYGFQWPEDADAYTISTQTREIDRDFPCTIMIANDANVQVARVATLKLPPYLALSVGPDGGLMIQINNSSAFPNFPIYDYHRWRGEPS